MRMRFSGRPSPATITVAVIASVAVAGSAIAGTDALNAKLNKPKVKKIAKKQANKQITKRAPGLSVAAAQTAVTAETANRFGGMTPTRIAPFTLGNGGSQVIGTFGPFTLTASCAINVAGDDTALVAITTSQNNSAFKGEDDNPDLDVGDTAEYVIAVAPTGAPDFQEDGGVAIAPDGTELLGHQLYAGVNVLGQGGICRFGGVIFATA
jgi:hypothetical protein